MIKRLDADKLIQLYNTSMKKTFPRQELKPLKAMLRMFEEGHYDVWGYYNQSELLAYACVCSAAEPVLLDYLAVTEAHRGEGHGSHFLKALIDEAAVYPSMMLEIESVEKALDEADRKIRMRRQSFYERLGFVLTATQASVFGEHYVVLANRPELEKHPVKDAMREIYHYMVPEREAFEKNVHIF